MWLINLFKSCQKDANSLVIWANCAMPGRSTKRSQGSWAFLHHKCVCVFAVDLCTWMHLKGELHPWGLPPKKGFYFCRGLSPWGEHLPYRASTLGLVSFRDFILSGGPYAAAPCRRYGKYFHVNSFCVKISFRAIVFFVFSSQFFCVFLWTVRTPEQLWPQIFLLSFFSFLALFLLLFAENNHKAFEPLVTVRSVFKVVSKWNLHWLWIAYVGRHGYLMKTLAGFKFYWTPSFCLQASVFCSWPAHANAKQWFSSHLLILKADNVAADVSEREGTMLYERHKSPSEQLFDTRNV